MKDHDIIDPNCPEVHIYNWEELNAEGWRWIGNVQAELVAQNEHLLQVYQYDHGKINVTIGDPWDRDLMKPIIDPRWIGIYVKDITFQIGRFSKEFDIWWESK